ncbi:MAG: hypothetical protein HQL14_00040 [Candidatus Omnitrophica bacterium]|nr:hypothetical protein [Candidatus Omnitrophota bacterium]
MIFRILLLFFCALGTMSAQAHAQFLLEQAKVSLNVSGGNHRNGTLMIHNTTSETAYMKVYWEDFEYKAPYDGTKNFLPAGTAAASAGQWVTFSPQVFTMPAFGEQKIDYTVSVPSAIQEGHYGVLFFERTGNPLKSETGVNVVTRIGCLFFIEPENKVKKAILQDIALKANSLTVSFVNQGNVILIPRTTYYMMQEGGLVLNRGESKKLYVPPGVGAPIEIPLDKKLKAGRYNLVVNCDLEEGDVVVQEIGVTVDASGQLTLEKN